MSEELKEETPLELAERVADRFLDMVKPELKPCPFCKTNTVIGPEPGTYDYFNETIAHHPDTKNCFLDGVIIADSKAWNTRHQDDVWVSIKTGFPEELEDIEIKKECFFADGDFQNERESVIHNVTHWRYKKD